MRVFLLFLIPVLGDALLSRSWRVPFARQRNAQVSSPSHNNEVDVSDLGLTMEDLDAPLPTEFLQGVESSGYQSTSRLPTVNDNACRWTETRDTIKAMLQIPGLRGQPAACLSHLTATNTFTITAFGQIVWSCILRGNVLPDTAIFQSKDGNDMVPVVDFEVKKADPNAERWGGFVLQIGENSLL